MRDPRPLRQILENIGYFEKERSLCRSGELLRLLPTDLRLCSRIDTHSLNPVTRASTWHNLAQRTYLTDAPGVG